VVVGGLSPERLRANAALAAESVASTR